jgi:hypothetical protein
VQAVTHNRDAPMAAYRSRFQPSQYIDWYPTLLNPDSWRLRCVEARRGDDGFLSQLRHLQLLDV